MLRYSFTIDGEMPLKLYVKLYKTVKGADYCREEIFTNGAENMNPVVIHNILKRNIIEYEYDAMVIQYRKPMP